MFTHVYCPWCHAMQFSMIDDFERNLSIFKCDRCGEMYAVSNEDLSNLGIEQIFKEWHRGYYQEPKALKTC